MTARPDLESRVAVLAPTDTLSAADRTAMLASILGTPAEAGRDHATDVVELLPGTRPAPAHHRRWLPAVAAAAVAAVVIGGAVEFGGGDSPSGDGVACQVALPKSWNTATSDAETDEVVSAAPDGTMLTARVSGVARATYRLVRPSGASIPVPTARGAAVVGFEGKHVVSYRRAAPESTDRADLTLVDVTVLDIATGKRLHLLQDPKDLIPSDYRWTDDEPGLVDGSVYVAAERIGGGGYRVIAYSLRTKKFRVAAAPKAGGLVVDASGAWWPGGGVRTSGTPSAVPAALDEHGRAVRRLVGDGNIAAWEFIDGPQGRFHWATADGRNGTFAVRAGAGSDPAGLNAAAGPYVFVFLNKQAPNRYVYDLRTGALATTATYRDYSSSPVGVLTVDAATAQRRHRVDVAKLPELRC